MPVIVHRLLERYKSGSGSEQHFQLFDQFVMNDKRNLIDFFLFHFELLIVEAGFQVVKNLPIAQLIVASIHT